MYWSLGELPGWAFWALAISFFAFGALMKGGYLSVTSKNPYPVVYPSLLIAFAFTQSTCSIVYLLPAFRTHQISKMFLENWKDFFPESEN
ncbi:hypothetical protein [Thermococcus stetteri]|uniref:hypothetical protein n=1 Tax=Thermococcus stetteri TaxID=49900 RepID=UPI001AE688BF|nr:hypothetical protein [Thermococcus stetteri]MBP1911507.1 hypothetical protein [Thermococcus stetteri]